MNQTVGKHIDQLDGLRAIAILGVLVEHFTPQGSMAHKVLPWGWLGVRLFFVLSGFLITGILLDCRRRSEDGRNGRSRFGIAGRFYVRRILRIFPIYYLTLAAITAIGLGGVRHDFWAYASYSSNWLDLFGTHPSVGPFWSLAVEEQFYIVWPWLLLWLPRRLIVPLVVALIIIAPVFRLVRVLLGGDAFSVNWPTPACLDSLGMGALLAIVNETGVGRSQKLFPRSCFWLGAPALTVVLWAYAGFGYGPAFLVLGDSAMAFFFTWLVWASASKFQGVAGRFLELPPLLYIGRISYGLYIYNYFAPWILPPLCNRLGLAYPTDYRGQLALCLTTTFAVAAFSWHFVEKPINGLKRFFPYNSARVDKPSEALVTQEVG